MEWHGANVEMAGTIIRCGQNIGIFINIRKCHVLYLHNNYGAWAVAPYLDKHGEVDPNLRFVGPLPSFAFD